MEGAPDLQECDTGRSGPGLAPLGRHLGEGDGEGGRGQGGRRYCNGGEALGCTCKDTGRALGHLRFFPSPFTADPEPLLAADNPPNNPHHSLTAFS